MPVTRLAAAIILTGVAALAGGRPAAAFACYVGEAAEGEPQVVNVHRRPDASSPVLARLERFAMVSDVPRVRERGGWIFVRWSRDQITQERFSRGHGDGKGWVRREAIRGECED